MGKRLGGVQSRAEQQNPFCRVDAYTKSGMGPQEMDIVRAEMLHGRFMHREFRKSTQKPSGVWWDDPWLLRVPVGIT